MAHGERAKILGHAKRDLKGRSLRLIREFYLRRLRRQENRELRPIVQVKDLGPEFGVEL